MSTVPVNQPGVPLRRRLRLMSGEALFVSLMIGAGEAYIAPFALALGFGEVEAGLLGTIPLLVGAVIQLISPKGVALIGSYRRWVVASVALQGLSFLPLTWAALAGKLPVWALFALVSVYWASGMSSGSAWNAWMDELLPKRIRAVFLGKRARLVQFGVIIGLALGGLLLEAAEERGRALTAFAMLFAISAAFRLYSAWLLAQHDIHRPSVEPMSLPGTRDVIGRARHGLSGRILLYLVVVQVAVQISGPFFTPFMLKKLEMSYAQFLLMVGTAFLAKMIVFPTVGRLAKAVGSQRLLLAGGLAIAPLPLPWLLSDNFYFLLGVQALSGTIWAIFEMASLLILFDSIRREDRTTLLTWFNLANCMAMVVGSLLGGAFLHAMSESHAAYFVIFALSGVARLAAVGLMPRVPADISVTTPIPLRPMSIRPNVGALMRPVLAAIRPRRNNSD